MSDPPTDRDITDGADSESPPATPRWVYALGVIALILVAAFVTSHLAGGGFRQHGQPPTVAEPAVQRP